MNFTDFIEETKKLRPEYTDYLEKYNPNWEDKLLKIVDEIPSIFNDIYSFCNGTDIEKTPNEFLDFLTGFRLLTIEEVVVFTKEIRELYEVEDEVILLPFLTGFSSDYIAYYKDAEQEKIILVTPVEGIGDIYDSVSSFWQTITQFYIKKAYFLDEDNVLDCDEDLVDKIAMNYNKNSDFWFGG